MIKVHQALQVLAGCEDGPMIKIRTCFACRTATKKLSERLPQRPGTLPSPWLALRVCLWDHFGVLEMMLNAQVYPDDLPSKKHFILGGNPTISATEAHFWVADDMTGARKPGHLDRG